MNRIAGIVFAALGLLVAVLSITKIVPGITTAGVVMILAGGLMIGLSFIDKPESEGVDRMSTPSTLANIFFSPTEVFHNLRRHPRWLVAVILISLMSTIFSNLFMNRLGAERVTNFAIDKTLEMPMVKDNDVARNSVEAGRAQAVADAKNPVIRVGQAFSSFGASIFFFAVIALIFFLFALAMGGKLNFWQAFSAAVYATFPLAAIRFVLNTILLYVKDPDMIHPITGAQSLIQDNLNFLVAPSEHPVIFTILGSLSLLSFYWVWLNAVGLKNTGERVTGTTAWSASITLFLVLLFLGATAAFLFPNFIS